MNASCDTAETTCTTSPADDSARNTFAVVLKNRPVSRRAMVKGAGVAMALGLIGAASALADAPADGATPPDMPAGEGGQGAGGAGDGGTPPDMPAGEGGAGGPGGMGGADTMVFDYAGTYTGALEANGETVTSLNESFDAATADQNAVLAQNAGVLTASGDTFTKSGDDTNGDNCNFYGVNSIALAVNEGSALYLDSCTLTATGEGSNGVFATDAGTAFVNGCSIATEAGNSRGLDATYGGTIVACDVDIQTQGDHCAGVANDRGGGSISLCDASIQTAGSGSPVLYSTGNIQVNNVEGTATGSQIAGMEGLNTILIANSTLQSTITGPTASDPVADGVIIYQSMSGDAEATTGEAATFQVVGSTLASDIQSGAMFYFTNTMANAVISATVLDFDATSAKLVYAAGNDANSWGSNGSNGATVCFTGIDQVFEGDVMVDTTSSLSLYLCEGTVWTGTAAIEENAVASTVDEPLTINVDATSTWVITADATVSALNVAAGGQVVDADGNAATIVAAGETVVSGPSAITVNVVGAYGTEVVTGEANELVASDAMIDRSAFDKLYGTSTAWTMA